MVRIGFAAHLNLPGLRCIHPYEYIFNSYTKRRWVGKPILEMFLTEFQAESPEYYVTLCDVTVYVDTLLAHGELTHLL